MTSPMTTWRKTIRRPPVLRLQPHAPAGRALLIGLAIVCGCAGSASAAALRVTYRITLAGLTLGQADLDGQFDGERYRLLLGVRLTGIAGLLSGSGRGSATAAGTVSGRGLSPFGFSATGRSSSAERTVQIGLNSGNVTEVEIKPPFEPRPDRVPLSEANKRGVIDPLTAILAAAADPDKPDQAANCDRTLPVFDGTQRFDVVLSYAETKTIKSPAYSGRVLVCNARYVPIAGHRPMRPAVKFMEENRDISVWLAPVPEARVLVPVRVSVRTMVGTGVVEAQTWAVTRTSGAEPHP